MKLPVLLLLVALAAAACQPAQEDIVIPTLAVLPTVTGAGVDETQEVSLTSPEAVTTGASETPTNRPTRPPTETVTPLPSSTARPTSTPDATRDAINTATAAALEAPVLSTLTPTPTNPASASGESTPTQAAAAPEVAADLTITEAQFQEQLDLLLAGIPEVERAVVNFIPNAIEVQLTASGGDALITGIVTIDVNISDGFATFSPGEIEVNTDEIPEAYLEVVYGDFFLSIAHALDEIRAQRVGEESRFENLNITEDAILITLLVPES